MTASSGGAAGVMTVRRRSRALSELPGSLAARSMSRRGNDHDNAVMERFFSTVEREERERFESSAHAKDALFDYIEAARQPASASLDAGPDQSRGVRTAVDSGHVVNPSTESGQAQGPSGGPWSPSTIHGNCSAEPAC